MKTINARGKACPEPVVMTKACVDQGEEELEILLDNPMSASNVMRFLESKDFSVLLKDDDGMLSISARKKGASEGVSKTSTFLKTLDEPRSQKSLQEPVAVFVPSVSARPLPGTSLPNGNVTFSVLITCKTLGQSDAQLGEVLMKSFLGTLSQLDNIPTCVALMNEGVKLALYDSSSCDHLKILEKKGVSVLVCGTCVNHFRLTEQIGTGTVSNMFEILEVLNKANKVITL